MLDIQSVNRENRVDHAIRFIADTIQKEGNEALGGVEQEVITLAPDSQLMSYAPQYQEFLKTLIAQYDPEAQLKFVDSLVDGRSILVGAKTVDGPFCPEVSTCTTEFATDPVRNAHDISSIIYKLASAFQNASDLTGCHALSTALVPNITFEDFGRYNAAMPNPNFAYSYGNITTMQRMEVSQTSFGNTSVHNNQGFDDPERMHRFARIALHIQPTMIALTANSPYWNGVRATDENGIPLLSRRSWLQTQYERTLGYSGLEYMYPSCLLDLKNTFGDYARGVMAQKLDRTYVNGEKTPVGALTMAQYITDGHQGHFPKADALNMMFSEPMIDVRFRPFGGARVETRAHDANDWTLAPALHAFYRGIAANLDEAEKLMHSFESMQEVRRQRIAVCYNGLASGMNMQDRTIRTQQDFARRLLEISRDGLAKRGLGEAVLLAPIEETVARGTSPAFEQIAFVEKECGGTLDTQDKMQRFMQRFRYAPQGPVKPAFKIA